MGTREGAVASGPGRPAQRVMVGVLDPLPMVRFEIHRELERRGYAAIDCPANPAEFLWRRKHRALVVSIAGDFGMSELDRTVRANRTAPIVALLEDPSPQSYADLFWSPSVHPARRSENAATVVRCLDAALSGMFLLPIPVARELANVLPTPTKGDITGEELSWLRRLADGTSVRALADDLGLSERTTYRRLGHTYGKLDARDRNQAIAHAVRAGLLERRA